MHTSGHHGERTVQVSGQHSAPQEQVRTTPSFVSHLVCATGVCVFVCVHHWYRNSNVKSITALICVTVGNMCAWVLGYA